MAKQRVTTTKTKTRVPKNGGTNKSGYRQCNMCKGSGIVRSHK
jgi:DnaJ-class molecular chaperone